MKAEWRTTLPGTARKPAFLKRAAFQPLNLEFDLIPPHGFSRPPRDHAHIVETEREQDRLLEPLIDVPLAVGVSLGDARFAGIEQVERRFHRLAHRTLGLRADLVAAFEGLVDDVGKLVV